MTLPPGAVLARGGVGAAEVQVGAAGVEGVGLGFGHCQFRDKGIEYMLANLVHMNWM